VEYRTHVQIDSNTQGAEDGKLFGTSGLEFTCVEQTKPEDETSKLGRIQKLGLYLETNAPTTHDHHLWSVGGERRLSRWHNLGTNSLLPILPTNIKDSIVQSQACRVILLTPAYFKNGWLPEFLLEPADGVTPKLIAACVGRPQVVSGWDYAYKAYDDEKRRFINGRPKPTRRLAPAGSVYFLRLEGEKSNIERWLEKTWMKNISDEDESTNPNGAFAARNDGFGLAAIGCWNGKLEQPKFEEGK
jgi:CRISPR-associated protein Cmr3